MSDSVSLSHTHTYRKQLRLLPACHKHYRMGNAILIWTDEKKMRKQKVSLLLFAYCHQIKQAKNPKNPVNRNNMQIYYCLTSSQRFSHYMMCVKKKSKQDERLERKHMRASQIIGYIFRVSGPWSMTWWQHLHQKVKPKMYFKTPFLEISEPGCERLSLEAFLLSHSFFLWHGHSRLPW